MKSLIRSLVVLAAVAAPALSVAQERPPSAQAQQSYGMSSDYGGTASGKEQTGSQQPHSEIVRRSGVSMSRDSCAGPISFCSIFFGS